jgi:hypothetical protein
MQRNYDFYYPEAAPGIFSGMGNSRIVPFINSVGVVNDTYTIVVPATPTSNTTYTVTVNGIAVSFTTDASATNSELEEGIFALMRSNPEFAANVDATLNAGTNTITIFARQHSTPLTVVAPQFTVARVTTTLPKANYVPFGRFVATKSTYPECAAALPTATSDKIVGVSLSNHGTEKQGIADDAIAGYPGMSTMNIVDRINDRKGVWVECVEGDLTANDVPYVSVAAGNEGKITKVTSGTISLASVAALKSGSKVLNGKNLVLVSFNLL